MRPAEIATACQAAQQRTGKAEALVYFLLPGQWGYRTTARLYPNGPMGTIVGANGDGEGVRVCFRADLVLRALQRLESLGPMAQEETLGEVMYG